MQRSFTSLVSPDRTTVESVNGRKKIWNSEQQQDHLYLDNRTTGQGWTFFLLGFFFFSVSSSLVKVRELAEAS